MNDTFYGAPRRQRANETWDTVDPRLVAALLHACPGLLHKRIWEPAAGSGLMAGQLRALGCDVHIVSDIAPRGRGVIQQDFLKATAITKPTDALVTNPPWGRLAAPFVRHALALAKPAKATVAMLLPLPWLTAAGVADLTGNGYLEAVVVPRFRARWMTAAEEATLKNGPASPKMNHVWLVWNFSRKWPEPVLIFVDKKQLAP